MFSFVARCAVGGQSDKAATKDLKGVEVPLKPAFSGGLQLVIKCNNSDFLQQIPMGCVCTKKAEIASRLQLATENSLIIRSQLPPLPNQVSSITHFQPRAFYKIDISSQETSTQTNNQDRSIFLEQENLETLNPGKVLGVTRRFTILVDQADGAKLERSIFLVSKQSDISCLNTLTINRQNNFEQEVLVVSSVLRDKRSLHKLQNNYYKVLDKKLYIRKDLKNTTEFKQISGQRSVFCKAKALKETLHALDGHLIENIQVESSKPHLILVKQNFPFTLSARLQCKNCKQLKLLMTNKAKLSLEAHCNCTSTTFTLLQLESSHPKAPLWLKGKKVAIRDLKDISIDKAVEVRAMGCNVCWRFQGCSKRRCGCLRCSRCAKGHPAEECVLCA